VNRPRPSAEVCRAAREAAARQLESGDDPSHVAECLLDLVERQKDLEALLSYTDRYLRFGMPEHELAAMQRLVDQLREDQAAVDERDSPDTPLPI